MPILKSVVIFLLEIIFISASVFSITSYAFKDILQKENVSNFIRTNLIPQMIEDRCTQNCQQALQQNITNNYDFCMQVCKDQTQNQTQDLDEYINNVYSQKIYGFTLEELTNFLNTYSIVFIIIVVVSGAGLLFLAANPFSRLGHALVSLAIPLLIIGAIPILITSVPAEYQLIASYIFEPMKSILTYGIVAMVAGIALSIYGYFYSKKKKAKK